MAVLREGRSTIMPFSRRFRFLFTDREIAEHAPQSSGVYGIFNHTGCVYVGEASDIQASLFAQLRGGTDESCWIRSQNPDQFAFERVAKPDRNQREHTLIVELDPVCNRP
jgi:excinuclease UvrABC nuclease subunit